MLIHSRTVIMSRCWRIKQPTKLSEYIESKWEKNNSEDKKKIYDTISIKRITPRHTNCNHKNRNKLNKERCSTLTSFYVRNETTRWMRYTLNVLWFFFAAFVVIIILSSWLLFLSHTLSSSQFVWHGLPSYWIPSCNEKYMNTGTLHSHSS